MASNTGDPQHLGGFLAEATAGVSFNEAEMRAAAAVAISEWDLMHAGPTTHSSERVQKCEQAIADHRAKGDKVPKQTVIDYRNWMRKLVIARQRDELHAARQAAWPGCWCLGFGGRYPSGLFAVTGGGRLVADTEGREMYRDYCGCPIGVDLEETHRSIKAGLLLDDQRRQIERLWTVCRSPRDLRRASLDTHPDQRTMTRIKRWYQVTTPPCPEEHKPGLLFLGPNQRGKTTVAFLLAQQDIEAGRAVIAMTVPDLIGKLTDTYNHDRSLRGDPDHPPQATHEKLIESLQTVPFLLLDDLGSEKPSDYIEQVYVRVLDARTNARLRTIITTNLKLDELQERLGTRIWSRLRALCSRVIFDGPALGPAVTGLEELPD